MARFNQSRSFGLRRARWKDDCDDRGQTIRWHRRESNSTIINLFLTPWGGNKLTSSRGLFVIPQAGHGLSGSSHDVNGKGESMAVTPIPNQFDKRALIEAWVEQGKAPGKTLIVSSGGRSLPLCSYPNYPRYIGGPPASAESYESAEP